MPATLDLDNYKKRVMGDMNSFPVTAPVQKSQRSSANICLSLNSLYSDAYPLSLTD